MEKLLVCPKCCGKLHLIDHMLKCSEGHSYDIASQGYVNLTLGKFLGGGDDKAMCRSRHEFHLRDYYSCLSSTLAEICVDLGVKSIIDAGCGEGYYLRRIREKLFSLGINLNSLCGIDLAKEAISIAAKCEKTVEFENRIEYAVAGIFKMPIADSSCDCVLAVFAPVPCEEAYRVLLQGGYLIVVSPGEKHLEGLKSVLYDTTYDNLVEEKEIQGFTCVSTVQSFDTIDVSGSDIMNLFHMTPYFWKTSQSDAKKITELSQLTTKIEFIIKIYKKIGI